MQFERLEKAGARNGMLNFFAGKPGTLQRFGIIMAQNGINLGACFALAGFDNSVSERSKKGHGDYLLLAFPPTANS